MFFKQANSVEKQLLNFRNVSVSHCFRSSSLTIIRNNLGLFNYKRMKKNLEFRKRTLVIIKKGIIQESTLALMHLWYISTIS